MPETPPHVPPVSSLSNTANPKATRGGMTIIAGRLEAEGLRKLSKEAEGRHDTAKAESFAEQAKITDAVADATAEWIGAKDIPEGSAEYTYQPGQIPSSKVEGAFSATEMAKSRADIVGTFEYEATLARMVKEKGERIDRRNPNDREWAESRWKSPKSKGKIALRGHLDDIQYKLKNDKMVEEAILREKRRETELLEQEASPRLASEVEKVGPDHPNYWWAPGEREGRVRVVAKYKLDPMILITGGPRASEKGCGSHLGQTGPTQSLPLHWTHLFSEK